MYLELHSLVFSYKRYLQHPTTKNKKSVGKGKNYANKPT
uniref:Uncharacterized protein n=1 Tax=Rhizophora mucronata TaxID=61149 RepID=A0A2P2PTM2_RHIMU